MEKTIYGRFVALAIFLSITLMVCPAFATTSTSFNLALSTNQIQFKIPAGTTFNGTIETSGMIRFWVTAPTEAQIVNLGIIDKSGTFSFVAQQNGTYTFNFENDLPNTVQVTFSYSANPQLPNGGTGTALSYTVIAIIVVAVAGSLLIILAVRRKSKKVAALQRKIAQTKRGWNVQILQLKRTRGCPRRRSC